MRLLLILTCFCARPALADPALWVIHGPEATVYLLGSIHMLKAGTAWKSPAIDIAIIDSREFWFEIDGSAADQLGLYAATIMNGLDLQHKLSDHLSPVAAERLHAVFGANASRVEHMRPWLVWVTLIVQLWTASGYSPAAGVDTTIRHLAQEARMPVHGFETGVSQIRLLAELPETLVLKSLNAILTTPPSATTTEVDDLARAWLAGDVDAIAKQTSALGDAEWTTKLVHDRNIVFAEGVQRLVQGHVPSMVVVGAAHMAGADGIPALLRQRGIAIERVP